MVIEHAHGGAEEKKLEVAVPQPKKLHHSRSTKPSSSKLFMEANTAAVMARHMWLGCTTCTEAVYASDGNWAAPSRVR
jgi:hypothetical protein